MQYSKKLNLLSLIRAVFGLLVKSSVTSRNIEWTVYSPLAWTEYRKKTAAEH